MHVVRLFVIMHISLLKEIDDNKNYKNGSINKGGLNDVNRKPAYYIFTI